METKKYILHWCLITFCSLLAITVIIFSFLCFCSPRSMAQFSATLSWEKSETYFYTVDFNRNNDISSLYKVVVNNYNLKNYKEVEDYYEKLESHERYLEFIKHLDEENWKSDAPKLYKSTLLNEDNYLKNRYVISLIHNGKLDKAFDYAVENFRDYQNYTALDMGTYLFYNLVDLNDNNIISKFEDNNGFSDTLYNELLNYIDQCINQFYTIFDQEELMVDIDGVTLIALNTRIQQVYSDITKISSRLNLETPLNLVNRVNGVNQVVVQLL